MTRAEKRAARATITSYMTEHGLSAISQLPGELWALADQVWPGREFVLNPPKGSTLDPE